MGSPEDQLRLVPPPDFSRQPCLIVHGLVGPQVPRVLPRFCYGQVGGFSRLVLPCFTLP
jgi:hypothetical protein